MQGTMLGLFMTFGHIYEQKSPLEPNPPKAGSSFSPAPKRKIFLIQTIQIKPRPTQEPVH